MAKASKGLVVSAVLGVALSGTGGLEAQKGKPLPPPPNWPCEITFRAAVTDTSDNGDKIKSDGLGAYKYGVDFVQCYVNMNGGGNDGNLFVNSSRTSLRSLHFPANWASNPVTATHDAYAAFDSRQPGYFEITDIREVLEGNGAQLRRVRVGVGSEDQFNAGEFWGDSSVTTNPLAAETDSAAVIATGPCRWTVTWESAPGRVLALQEGSSKQRVRTGDFQLPFEAYVRVTGVKPGCTTTP